MLFRSKRLNEKINDASTRHSAKRFLSLGEILATKGRKNEPIIGTNTAIRSIVSCAIYIKKPEYIHSGYIHLPGTLRVF